MWLKYRHKFSYGVAEWEWRDLSYLGEDYESEVKEFLIPELAEEYPYSDGDKYRGIDYEIVEKAPIEVIQDKIAFCKKQQEYYAKMVKDLEDQL